MEIVEVLLIIATVMAATGCALGAIRYTYQKDGSAQAKASLNADEADRAPETYRFAKLFQERRFSILFLAVLAIVTGIVAHFQFMNTASYVDYLKLSLVYLAGIAAMVIDLKYHRIPNLIPLTLIIGRFITILYEFLFRQEVAMNQLISSLLGFAICFVVLFVLSKAMHNGIGMGDVKLLSAIGFMCGIYAVCSILLVGLLASCVISIVLLISKIKKVKDYIPFAPFIYIGIFGTIIFGIF